MDIDNLEVDLGGQGHRSKVKVTRSKNVISGLLLQGRALHMVLKNWSEHGHGILMTLRSTLEVKVKGQGHKVKKCDFRPHSTVLQAVELSILIM